VDEGEVGDSALAENSMTMAHRLFLDGLLNCPIGSALAGSPEPNTPSNTTELDSSQEESRLCFRGA